tara:strand:- start:1285 stop:1425 length:141 start_codon:yes stop_codon:yes gene_type:complete
MSKSSNHQNGKGSAPRNNTSKDFRDNYSKIKWSKMKKKLDKIKHKE